MRMSLDKLRWLLAASSLGLMLMLALFVGYGRYKAARRWKEHLDRLGIHLEKTTDGFTYSQSQKGRTVFTLHAAKAIERGEGKVTLHDVILTLYGQGRTDRIYGNQFEYDDKAGIARAVGDVQMDLQAPEALDKSKGSGASVSRTNSSPADAAAHDIHVHTSGLVYVKKLGVAATDQIVAFNYMGLDCTAKGAEFDTGESIVHLLANVELHGDVRGTPLTLHAAKADLNRTDNTAALQSPVMDSRGQHAQAENALFHLRTDGSVEAGEATGSVVFQKGTQRITAAHANGTFDKDNHPQRAKLTGGVAIDNSGPEHPLHGRADEAVVLFDPLGEPLHISATGNARLDAHAQATNGQTLTRTMHGNQIEAAFKPGHGKTPSALTNVHVVGNALATGESPASPTGIKTLQIAADDLRAAFAPGAGRSPDLKEVWGEGNTRLQQNAPLGDQQISTGDHLQILFAPAAESSALQVASAAQNGHVQVRSQGATRPGASAPEPVVANADKSAYDGQSSRLVLTGSARFTQGDTSVTANTVQVDQHTGDSDAEGDVLATFSNSQQPSSQAAHVRSSTAHLQHASQAAQFRGTDAKPARLWQGASQVEAATLFLDGQKRTLAARPEHAGGVVHAVFASLASDKPSMGQKQTVVPTSEGGQVARVAANTMDYDDRARAASFGGNVHVDSDSGQVQSQHAVAFLKPAQQGVAKSLTHKQAPGGLNSPMDGSLDRIVMWGNVSLKQPGRDGRGDRMVYTAADQSFLLTGSPGKLPQVVDSKQGNVTGAALLFRNSDSTIIVTGTSGTGNDHGRVRTETGAKQ